MFFNLKIWIISKYMLFQISFFLNFWVIINSSSDSSKIPTSSSVSTVTSHRDELEIRNTVLNFLGMAFGLSILLCESKNWVISKWTEHNL